MAKLNTPLPLRVIAFRSCTSYLSTSPTWPCSNARTSRPTSSRSRTEIVDTTSALVWQSPIKKMHFCLDFFRREKEGLGGVSCNVKREQELNLFQGSGIEVDFEMSLVWIHRSIFLNLILLKMSHYYDFLSKLLRSTMKVYVLFTH